MLLKRYHACEKVLLWFLIKLIDNPGKNFCALKNTHYNYKNRYYLLAIGISKPNFVSRNYRMYMTRNYVELEDSKLRGITWLEITWNYMTRNCVELHDSKLRGITWLEIAWKYMTRNYVELQDSKLRGITWLAIAWNYRTRNCVELQDSKLRGITGLAIAHK